MRAVVFTEDLALYAAIHAALTKKGWKVSWKSGEGLVLADLAHLEKGWVWCWRTSWGLRAYDPRYQLFLTRKDDPRTLAEGLQGKGGLGLLPGERGVFWALGQGVVPKGGALARHLGIPPHRARFYLRGLRNKFGLPEEELVRLARHQVQVVGLQGHAKPLAGMQAQPFLHVAGQEEAQGHRSLEVPTVGQPLGIQAF